MRSLQSLTSGLEFLVEAFSGDGASHDPVVVKRRFSVLTLILCSELSQRPKVRIILPSLRPISNEMDDRE